MKRWWTIACIGPGLVGMTACMPALDLELELIRAHNAVFEGHHEWARPTLERYLQARPDDAAAWRLQAEAWRHGRAGSLNRATAALARYVELMPDDIEARRQLLGLEIWSDRMAAATATASALGNNCSDRRVVAELRAHSDPGGAVTDVEELLAECPASMNLHRLAARVLPDQEALPHARRAVELDPLHRPSLTRLLELERDHGDGTQIEPTLELFEVAQTVARSNTRRLSPRRELELLKPVLDHYQATSPALRYRHALLLLYARDSHADDAVDVVIADPATSPEKVFELAQAARAADRHQLAFELLARLTAVEQGNLQAQLNLAELAMTLERTDEAERMVTALLDERPPLARAHYQASRLALAGGERARASTELAAAVRLAPWADSWRQDLLELYLDDKNLQAARLLVDEAPAGSHKDDLARLLHGG